MSFAENFIAGYGRGQSAKRNKRIEEEETEDRDIEKQILAHRLKEIKISEKMKARNAARENFETQHGQSEADIPWDGQSTKKSAMPGAVGEYDVPNKEMAPVNFPGIEELGIPGVSRRPQSMEQMLTQMLTQKRGEARSRGYEVSEGESVALPGVNAEDPYEVIKGQPKSFAPRPARAPIRDVARDASGKETTVFRDPDTLEVVGQGSTRDRVPPRPSGGGSGITRATQEQIDDVAEGIRTGRIPASKAPNATSDFGARVLATLGKDFDLTTAGADQAAFNKYLGTLNGESQQRVLQASEVASNAMVDLEKAITAGDSKAAELAAGIIRAELPILKSGGAAPTNRILDESEKAFKPGWAIQGGMKTMLPQIARLKKHLAYRAASTKGSFVSADEAGGVPETGVEPETDAVVAPPPVKPAAAGAYTAQQVEAELKKQGRASQKSVVDRVMKDPAALRFLFTGK